MTTVCYFIVLIFNALLGWFCVPLLLNLIFFKEKELKKGLTRVILREMDDNLIITKIEEFDLENELEPVIDQRLDGLLNRYREESPMIGLFLTPDLGVSIKAKGKEEIIKALPEIKAMLISKVKDEFNMEQIISEKIAHLSLNTLIQANFKKELFQLKSLSALIALGVGLIEVVLLYLFSTGRF